MEWTPDLSVGVEAIDDQHKELIRRMNVFFESMEGDNQQRVLDMLVSRQIRGDAFPRRRSAAGAVPLPAVY